MKISICNTTDLVLCANSGEIGHNTTDFRNLHLTCCKQGWLCTEPVEGV